MENSLTSFGGVMPPIPTPFTPAGDVAYDALTQNLERWNGYALSGYLVLGSNGETVYLTGEEKLRILETARRAIPKDKTLIAGTGCESTRETIDLTQRAAEIGADAALVITPHFYGGKMILEALANHYFAVADASPIPVLVYNVPKFTHLDLDAASIAHLAEHPNILGVKDSGGNITKLGDMVRLTGGDFQVFAGSAGFFLPALVMGAAGSIMAMANVAPQQAIDIQDLFREGRLAAELQRRMIPVNGAVTARFGVAGLKAALDMLGYYGGPVRSPLQEISEKERESLRTVLSEAGVL